MKKGRAPDQSVSSSKHHRPLSSEELGRKGEFIFASMTPDASLVANKAADADIMGWDYFLEFSHDLVSVLPLDKRPHPLECKIQIKTIWDDRESITLTLSAADKLARSRFPSFIIVIKMGENLQPTSMHGIHMTDGNLSKVLKRLRQASAKNSLQINKQTLSFDVRSATPISLNGLAIRNYIQECCGEDIDAYVKQKQNQIKSLGFPERRYSMSFSFNGESEKELNRIFLGLREAEVTRFKTEEVRFGIKWPISFVDSATVKITPNPVEKCRISIRNKKYPIPVKIDAEVYLPAIRIGKELTCRVSNELIDIVISGDTLEVHHKYDDNTKMTVGDMMGILRFQEIIFGSSGYIEIAARGKKFVAGNIDLNPDGEMEKRLSWETKVVGALRVVLDTAGMRNVKVSISDVMRIYNDVFLLHDLISGENSVRLQDMKLLPRPGKSLDSEYDGVFIRRLDLDDAVVGFYFTITVRTRKVEGGVIISFRNFSLRDVSEIERGADSYVNYCDEAKAEMGVGLVLTMSYEDRDLPTRDPAMN